MAERIILLLSQRGLSQFELAKKSGVSGRTIYNALKTKQSLRPSILGRLADALGVSVEYLRTGVDVPAYTGKSTSGSQVHEAPAVYSTNNEMSVQKAIKFISEQFGMPEHLFWDCLKKVVEERGRQGPGKPVRRDKAG